MVGNKAEHLQSIKGLRYMRNCIKFYEACHKNKVNIIMENMDQWESPSENESTISSRSSRHSESFMRQQYPKPTSTPVSISAAKFIRKRRERMLGISASSGSSATSLISQRPVRIRRSVLQNKSDGKSSGDSSSKSSSQNASSKETSNTNKDNRKGKSSKIQAPPLTPMQMEIRRLYDSICRSHRKTLRENINKAWSDNWQNVSSLTKLHNRFQAMRTMTSLESHGIMSSEDILQASGNAVKNKLSTVDKIKVSVISEGSHASGSKQDQRVPAITIGHVSQIPPVLDWTAIPHNMHEDDGKFLTNIPFLGDEFIEKDSNFIDEMVTLYEGKVHEDKDSSCFGKLNDEVLYFLVQAMMKIEMDAPGVFKEPIKVETEKDSELKDELKPVVVKRERDPSPKKTTFSDVAAKLFTHNFEAPVVDAVIPQLVNECIDKVEAENKLLEEAENSKLSDPPQISEEQNSSKEKEVIEKCEKESEQLLNSEKQFQDISVDKSVPCFDGDSSFDSSRPSDDIFNILSKTFSGVGSPGEIRERYENAEKSRNTPPLPILRNGMEQHKPESYSIPNIEGPFAKYLPKDATMHAYQFLFCRRCFVYDCKRHTGDDQVDSKHYKRNRQMSPSAASQLSIAASTNTFGFTCENPECWQINDFIKRNAEEILAEWTPGDRSLFLCFIDSFPSNFCFIAYLMRNKSCSQVKEYADLENVPLVESCHRGMTPRSRSKHRKKLSANSSKKNVTRRWINKVKKTRDCKDEGGIKSSGGILPIRYMPCLHENGEECDASCTCRINKTSCEKFCTCALTCPYRFPGCKCLSTCDSKRCICFAAARECDPDLCLGCGANETELEKISCHNVNIQRKLHKHLLMGRSDISGWGIYIMNDAQKGEFIAEYRGELISYDESERRGHVYDKIQHTFLFELNDHFVVDATRKGNKARFVNSSKNPNCEVKRMLVNGDHRIGIYAKRFIEAGEELFYDYEDVLEKQQKAAEGMNRKRKE